MHHLSKKSRDVTFQSIINDPACKPSNRYSSWYESNKSLNKGDYATPAFIDKTAWSNYAILSEDSYPYKYISYQTVKKLYLEDWCNLIEDYINLKFNANYKTIDSQWKKSMKDKLPLYYASTVDEYYTEMKKNQTIVQLGKVCVEPSTFYSGDYIRVYIKFKVTSAKNTKSFSKILFPNEIIEIENFKIGEWIEVYTDISVGYLVFIQSGLLPDIDDYKIYAKRLSTTDKNNKMLGPLADYSQVKIQSGERKGWYKWEYKK